ncbi:sugar ABC transporter ATP-binding protein [Faecalicatena contorta]|uniref:Monosaccharide ABC transporter ATP-binding protein, CUT2 family n=1 Tax=Faecalicatena contorta TaxID=39482 RepID=A0A316A2I9_9FIRM|nr:sugar ABC transporter ATP-binding protein [Faecalicatena contorta]PWJ51865.1 monosaccharide ABC transporter ATP-binding protein (CUT2 family) [Faecalicatena contorta]SUQ12128.1 monosaccharide ABC transporter ATP-binding protein, CUT2 family [Faecalicatena contorta]
MLKMNHISKGFPGVKALDDISISVKKGEIHALVGENGAGKSTLMKILSGAYSLDSGEIILDGEKIENTTPAKMIEKGIAVIYQELMLLSHCTVAENIFLNRYPKTKMGKIDYKKMDRNARKVIQELKLDLDTKAIVKDLSVAKRQMVEIAKAMSRNAKVVVLDEPTAVLGDNELEGLFGIVRQLAAEGVTFIYISHRLKEIFEICTNLTIMKDGKFVESGAVEQYTTEMLVSKMVGRDVKDIYPKREKNIGDVILSVKGLTRRGIINNINFDLRRGEIIGIAGLAGAGRSEILRAIIGADPIDEGTIELEGKPVRFRNVKEGILAGLGIVPEERKEEGLMLQQNIIFNMTIPALKQYKNRFGTLKLGQEAKIAKKYIETFQVRPGSAHTITKFMSGGNQQKVVLAKWIAADCKILLVDEPTRGVDVGAKEEIYEILNQLIGEGLSIIMVSSELPELLGTCDRIMVMNEGKQTGLFNVEECSEETLMRFAAN